VAYKRNIPGSPLATFKRKAGMLTLSDWKNVTVIDPEIKFDYEKQFTLTQEHELKHALSLCEKAGMFLEFGVFQGKTITICANYLPNITFHGFDSFEGLPEEWDLLMPGNTAISKFKQIPAGHFAVDKLPTVPKNVLLHKGWFNESVVPWKKQYITPNSYISFLNLDADLYSSTIYVLNELNDYIKPGCVIRFDELVDWRLEHFPCRGYENPRRPTMLRRPKPKYSNWPNHEWKALNEWLEKYNRKVKPAWRSWHQAAGVIVEV
jgi:hypothetical protein